MNKFKILMIIVACFLVGLGAAFILKGQSMRSRTLGSDQTTSEQQQTNDDKTNSPQESLTNETASGKTETKQIALEVSQPENNSTVKTSSVLVKGTTSPKADVFINDIETKSNEDGSFSATVYLDEGNNYIIVTITDADGNFAEKELSVTNEP